MKRTTRLLLLASVAALATGCVKQSEYDADLATLTAWTVQVHAWQTLTRNVICDIIAKNTPDVNPPYAPQTLTYCPSGGTEGDGEPPDPPEFGLN